MTPVTHDSDEWKTLLSDVRSLQKGQHNLEVQMTSLLGTNGEGGLIGVLVSAVDKLDKTVGEVNTTMIGWKAILSDRKDRHNLWFPIIAALLTALLVLLLTMWSTHSGRAALSKDNGISIATDAPQTAGGTDSAIHF